MKLSVMRAYVLLVLLVFSGQVLASSLLACCASMQDAATGSHGVPCHTTAMAGDSAMQGMDGMDGEGHAQGHECDHLCAHCLGSAYVPFMNSELSTGFAPHGGDVSPYLPQAFTSTPETLFRPPIPA